MSSHVTRSMEATTPVGAAMVDRRRRSLPGGWWGMLLFLCSEATLFGLLIASYFYLRFQNVHWPPMGIEKPKVALPMVLTAILVASTAPLFAAVRAGRLGRTAVAWWLVLLAAIVQAGYLGVQIHEFLSDIDKVQPKASSYGSIYLALIGIHHVHVAVGILPELWLLARLLGGLTNYRLTALRVVALYWYFVAALAIPVVFTQTFPSL